MKLETMASNFASPYMNFFLTFNSSTLDVKDFLLCISLVRLI